MTSHDGKTMLDSGDPGDLGETGKNETSDLADLGGPTDLGEDVTLAADDDVVAKIRSHAANLRAAQAAPAEPVIDELRVWTAPDTAAQGAGGQGVAAEPRKIDVAALSMARADAVARSLKPAVAEPPVGEEPVPEEPVAEEPVAEEPLAPEAPVAAGPTVSAFDPTEMDDDVTVGAGNYRELLGLRPLTPHATEPLLSETALSEPAVSEPLLSEPALSEPLPVESLPTEPEYLDPAFAELAPSELAIAQPVPAQPVTGSLIDGMAPPTASTTFWTSDKQFRASGIDEPLRRERRTRVPFWIIIALAVVLIVAASVAIALLVAGGAEPLPQPVSAAQTLFKQGLFKQGLFKSLANQPTGFAS